VVNCTTHGTHTLTSKLACRCLNGAHNAALGSWSAKDAGGGMRFSQGLMGRRKSGFEKVDLQDSIDLADEMLKETIHDRGEADGKGWNKQ
jgi:hypothetical protein